MNAGAVQRRADVVLIRRAVELHRDLGSAAEVDTQRNVVPEQHAQNAGDRKNQGEAEEVPLLPQPVDIDTAKQFHL